MLIQELAEKIIMELRKLLEEDVIVVNTKGIIIASTDPERINTFHEGALIASQRKDKLVITESDQTILKGVKAGINLPIFFQGNVVGIIGITGKPDAVSPYGEIIRKMTELLISESYYTEQFDWQSRSVEAFLLDWIQLKEWNEDFLNKAKLLHIDVQTKRRVLIAEVETDASTLHRESWLSILSWNEKGEKETISRWGNNRIIYLLSADKQNTYYKEKAKRFHQFLMTRLKTNVSIGIGLSVPPIQLKTSFHQAERALNSRKSKNDIIFDEDLAFEMILDEINEQTKEDFVARTIQPLLKEKELLQTLRTLIDNHFSLKKTSETMHIHINTLHYRLKKITDLTNLNPRNLDDLFILYLALVFLDKYTNTIENFI